VTRLWAGDETFDVEYTLGPIPHRDGGKDVVARYETDLATGGVFFTDANGRDSNRRVYNERPSFNLTVEEAVSGNYYPVSGFAYLADAATGATLSVAPDRAQGGASLADGALELMLHRRLQKDDALGAGEALNEPGLSANGTGLVIRTTQRLLVGASPAAAAVARRAALGDSLCRPQLPCAPIASPAAWRAAARATNFSGLRAPLPGSLHLLTAHAWGPAQLLLRVAHSFEAGEGGAASGDAQVGLGALFSDASGVALGACVERTVGGAQDLAAVRPATYAVSGGGPSATLPILPPPPAGAQQTVTLSALEIRTFLCDASFRE
jgi:lysosomal alpha-mannosidase